MRAMIARWITERKTVVVGRLHMVEREVPTSDSGRSAAIGFYSLPQDAIHQAGERGQRYAAAVVAAKAEVRRGR